jgi:hypothetical protein
MRDGHQPMPIRLTLRKSNVRGRGEGVRETGKAEGRERAKYAVLALMAAIVPTIALALNFIFLAKRSADVAQQRLFRR